MTLYPIKETRGGGSGGGRPSMYDENMIHTNVSLLPSQFDWLAEAGESTSAVFRDLLEKFLDNPDGVRLAVDPVSGYTNAHRPERVKSRSFHVLRETEAKLKAYLIKHGLQKNPLLRQVVQTAMHQEAA